MITFKMDFDGDESERQLADQIERKIRSRLMEAGLGDLEVSFRKEGNDFIYDFSGPDADVAKAKKILEDDTGERASKIDL